MPSQDGLYLRCVRGARPPCHILPLSAKRPRPVATRSGSAGQEQEEQGSSSLGCDHHDRPAPVGKAGETAQPKVAPVPSPSVPASQSKEQVETMAAHTMSAGSTRPLRLRGVLQRLLSAWLVYFLALFELVTAMLQCVSDVVILTISSWGELAYLGY